jgi:enoyl-CoA hydratase/carnithine racemase
MEQILTEVDETGVAIVTLNRPAKRNAVSLAMWQALGPLFDELGADDKVKAVVLTGAGGNFSGGADISEFSTLRTTPAEHAVYAAAGDAAALGIRDCTKPTFAAVHGFGVGGGCGLSLCCDFRVGDATTRMGIPAAQRGIVYTELDTSLLLRQVGLSRAKLVLYSAHIFDSQQCREMGLLDLVGEAALPAAIDWARRIAANAPLSVRGSKLMLEALASGQMEQRRPIIEAAANAAANSEDFLEATQSFVEKRPAVFKGK